MDVEELLEVEMPINGVPRAALTWEAGGTLGFAVDSAFRDSRKRKWMGEMPYDDL